MLHFDATVSYGITLLNYKLKVLTWRTNITGTELTKCAEQRTEKWCEGSV
jgi:hypothetical protein